MRKLFALAASLAISTVLVAGSLLAAPLPLLTPASGCNEASQLLACLNQYSALLNGTTQPTAPLVSFGSTGTISGATPLTLNTQRGVASFTGVATLVTGAVTTLVLNDSLVTVASQCFTQVQSGGAAGSGPYIATATPTAGVLTLVLANGGTTATGAAQTFAVAFNCM